MGYSEEIQVIFDKQEENGGPFWSREDGDVHAPHGSSTIDTMEVLGELGTKTKKHPTLLKAIDFLFEYQNVDGSFKYSKASSKLPSMTARIPAALARLGVGKDKRAEKGYYQLLDSQCSDGGWRCNTVRIGKSRETDASNPGTTLYVLDAFRFRSNSPKEIKQLNKGVDFLLNHWETKSPLGPCDFGIGSRFLRIEFPFLRYNLFYYVYALSFYKHAREDPRFLDAYKALWVKTRNEEVIPENPHRAWRTFHFAKTGQVSKLATKCWLEIKKNMKEPDVK